MTSSQASKVTAFLQRQEVRWGYRSDRLPKLKAATETTSSLSDGISVSAGNSLTYISFRQTSVNFQFLPVPKWKAPITLINHFCSSLCSYCNYECSGGILLSVVRRNVYQGGFFAEEFIQMLTSAARG